MNLLHKSYRVFCYQLSRIFITPRIPLVFVLLGIYLYSTVAPVADFSRSVKISAAPWVFPHLTNDYICQLVIMAGVVFLFCDAPFFSDSRLYILARSGQTAWTSGHVMYIFVMSFIYVFFVLGISILPLVGNLQWISGWGKILGTLAKTNAGSQFGLTFTVSSYLTGAYEPYHAMIFSFCLEWACAFWIGLLIYLFNTMTHKMVGTFLAVAFILLNIMISNEWTPAAFAISPLTLAQLSSLTGLNQRYGITLDYAVRFYIISLCIMVIFCIISGNIPRWILSVKQRYEEKHALLGKESRT